MTKHPFRQNRAAVLGGLVLLIVSIGVLAWPVVLKIAPSSGAGGIQFASDYQPDQVSADQFANPGGKHWVGTDVDGRDLFSRVLFGTQISLLVGIVGAGVSLFIGVLWGAVAGYVGGRTDSFMM